MSKLLVAGKLHPAGVSRIFELEQEGYSITYIEDTTEASYANLISDVDALIICLLYTSPSPRDCQ